MLATSQGLIVPTIHEDYETRVCVRDYEETVEKGKALVGKLRQCSSKVD